MKSTFFDNGTLLFSADRRLSTIRTFADDVEISSRTRLLPTNPAPPTTRIWLRSNVFMMAPMAPGSQTPFGNLNFETPLRVASADEIQSQPVATSRETEFRELRSQTEFGNEMCY